MRMWIGIRRVLDSCKRFDDLMLDHSVGKLVFLWKSSSMSMVLRSALSQERLYHGGDWRISTAD